MTLTLTDFLENLITLSCYWYLLVIAIYHHTKFENSGCHTANKQTKKMNERDYILPPFRKRIG